MKTKKLITAFVALFTICVVAFAAEEAVNTDLGTLDKEKAAEAFKKRPYSPYADRKFPMKPLFGDTHLHTGFSMDAGAFGCRLTPRDAYRFARGEQVMASSGQPAKLSRPLDFLVVSDHSDNMGMFSDLLAGKPELLKDPTGRRWYDMIQSGQGQAAALELIGLFSQGKFPKALEYAPGTRGYRGAWQETIDAAEAYNHPGHFTAFIGYEWTSLDKGNNLHRNVIFRDNADRASQVEPMTCVPPLGSTNPIDLWKWMDAYQKKTGGSVLAIAHNGNLSNGTMFPIVEAFGKAIDRDYVEQRAKWEVLYEATQMKGDGEAHPFLSPNDEFADYETWDFGNLDGSAKKKNEMLEFEYTRSALKNGLKLEAKFGTNPYKFGLVGSSDAHTGLASFEEDNFFGKTTPSEPSAHRLTATFMNNEKSGVKIMDWQVTSSGYAVVWAEENTRRSIFDAMARKETYATTGSRLVVRFFGGWDFDKADANSREPAVIGYTKGVPMGGDLNAADAAGKSPTFLCAAMKDPLSGNLDRIQIIKGWLDAKGDVQEKVYDAAWSGDRKPDATGKIPSVGTTVDVENATWSNTIGAPELIAVWKDPQFDAKQRAFYYVRVIEIPTPRWTAYDAKRYGVKPLPGTNMITTERAYTSPIWFNPAK
jgi:hypothetical protein